MAAIVCINTSHIKNFQQKDRILGLSAKKVELLLTRSDRYEATKLRGFSWLNNVFWSIFSSRSTLKSALVAIHDQIHSSDEEKTPSKTLLKLHEISKLANTSKGQRIFLESVVFTPSPQNNNSELFQGTESLVDYEINIASHQFTGIFLKAKQQQRNIFLHDDGSLKPEIIDTLSSSVPISYDDIMENIHTIFGEQDFIISDSIKNKDPSYLLQDRAWSIQYPAQSLYLSCGRYDSRNSFSENEFLLLSDLEKIQFAQLRGAMAGVLNALRMNIAQNDDIESDKKTVFLRALTKGDYLEFHKEFVKQYLKSKIRPLKEIGLKQLKEIELNLLTLKTKLKSKSEQLKEESSEFEIDSFTLLNCGIKLNTKNSKLRATVDSRIISVVDSIRKIQQMPENDYTISPSVTLLFAKTKA